VLLGKTRFKKSLGMFFTEGESRKDTARGLLI
jgi:hypothetical protein